MDDILTIKIIIIGDMSVGKTSLLIRFVEEKFDGAYDPTIGIDAKSIGIQVGDNVFKLYIHDTAGQERFAKLTDNFYRHVDGIILVYDVTELKTFSTLSTWLNEVKAKCEGAPVLIVGNKTDQASRIAVQTSVVQSFATQNEYEFMETSAYDNSNVDEAFFHILKLVIKNKGYNLTQGTHMKTVELAENETIEALEEFKPTKLSKSRIENLSRRLHPTGTSTASQTDECIRLHEPAPKKSWCFC